MSVTVAAAWDFTGITLPCSTEGVDEQVLADAEVAARQYLWALSGRRVGLFTTTGELYRAPCTAACGIPYKGTDGQWRNGSGAAHSCCSLPLFQQPIRDIDAVRVHGVTLDPASYALEQSTLRRVGACWPCEDECDPAPIEVDYQHGLRPDSFALLAAASLQCEFIAGWGGGACRLPSRVTSITRQGVSMDLDTAIDWANEGLTGIATVDAYLRVVNPNRLVQRSRVGSVDLPRRVG